MLFIYEIKTTFSYSNSGIVCAMWYLGDQQKKIKTAKYRNEDLQFNILILFRLLCMVDDMSGVEMKKSNIGICICSPCLNCICVSNEINILD